MAELLAAPAAHTIATHLQSALADLIHLTLLGKQLHWNVTGPRFQSVHEQLDLFVTEQRLWYDLVAERVTTLGLPVDGRLGTVAATTPQEDDPDGWVADDEVVALFARRITGVVERLRAVHAAVDDADPITGDMLVPIIAGLEKQRWMLVAQGR